MSQRIYQEAMERHYLQYWLPDQAEAVLSEGTLERAGSGQYSGIGLARGDHLWIVTGVAGRLKLVGHFDVAEVVSKQELETRLGIEVFDKPTHAIARVPSRPVLRDIMDIAAKLRFNSPNDRLDVSGGLIDGRQLQRIRQLATSSVQLLSNALHARPKVPAPRLRSKGAGFGSPEQNALVEAAAVDHVTQHFEKQKWAVRPVERDNCGYDLVCTRREERQNVEVKGISGAAEEFIITENEIRCSKVDDEWCIAIVTTALTQPSARVLTRAEFHDVFKLTPISYRAKRG